MRGRVVVLKLPSKRWKKVRIKPDGPGRYTLTFISPLKNEDELREIVDEEIDMCLDEGERVIDMQWERKSLTLAIADIVSFKRRLLYVNINSE